MKTGLLLLLFLYAGNSFSQDETSWIQHIDSTEFKLFYHKKHLPKAFYQIQGIETPKELANPTDRYSPCCTNPVRGQLNWMAKRGGKSLICITNGGSAVITRVYLLDSNTGKLIAHSSVSPLKPEITFGEFLGLLQSEEVKLEQLNPVDFKE